MENIDYWHLCDELSVIQAALLIAGQDPAINIEYVEGWKVEERPAGYEAAKSGIMNAIINMRLAGTVRYSTRHPHSYKEDADHDEHEERDGNGDTVFVKNCPDPMLTTVEVQALQEWLASRRLNTGFFFQNTQEAPNYLNSQHPHYAPKLAAAIKAWEAMTTNPDLMQSRTAKQAMIKWLRQHANEYGLTKDDGNPNENGIEDIAKIANWDSKGGAPKSSGN